MSLAFWAFHDAPPPFAPENRQFATWGLLAYLLDGIAWIFYYQSILYGPISIVGTLSAAYPALTVLFARAFLAEQLGVPQMLGVVAVIAGCLALAYTPPDAAGKRTRRRWMAYAGAALLIWGANGAMIRHAYRFPGAHEANMALFIAIGGLATLGVYGFVFSRREPSAPGEWARALGPMATMAVGSLLAAIAYKYGPASIVTPLSGAYPVVTLAFALGGARGTAQRGAARRDRSRAARHGAHHDGEPVRLTGALLVRDDRLEGRRWGTPLGRVAIS